MTIKLYNILLFLKTLFRQLWLSVTSINFYYDVYKFYTGYGFKYFFTVTFMASLIYCCAILNIMLELKNYFVAGTQSKATIGIEYLIKQLPDIYYDGNTISIEEESPLYLYNNNGDKIAVIDHKGLLSYPEKLRIPILLTSDKAILSLTESTNKKKFPISINYSKLFGHQRQVLSQEVIKKHFALFFSSAPTILIYVMLPALVFFLFVFTLLENIFIIILIYSLTYIFGPQSSLQTCIRLVSFACGVSTVIHPIIIALIPELGDIVWIVKMWTNFLLFLALLQVKRENN